MKHIVIIGGGFGGIRCALDIVRGRGEDFKVTVIDRSASHIFTPALYEVASAYPRAEGKYSLKLRQCVSVLYSKIFENRKVSHIVGEVVSVDISEKIIYIQDKGGLPYDYCVISAGNQATDFGTLGVSEHAYFFKTIDDSLSVNNRIHELFDEYRKGLRDKPLQILVVGAGFTGVELASELASCLYKLGKRYGLGRNFFSIMLFEAAPQMLPMLSAKERLTISSRLTKIGVGVSEHSPIESVSEGHIKLVDGHTAKGDMIIWTAGTKPNQLLSKIPNLPLTDHGRVSVNENLQVQGVPSLYAVGDAIEFIDSKTQQPVPALAYMAIDQAKVVAFNIKRAITGKTLKIYNPKSQIWIAPVGGKFAVAHLSSSITISGIAGWVIRYLTDLKYFASILPFSRAVKLLKKDIILFSSND